VRITRCQIRDMRRYRDLDMDFAPGLTVVRGPNEAGKTTIQRALELALTRKVTSTNGDLESHRPWDAQAEARPVIRLEFTTEDDEGTRKGVLEKSFLGPKGTVRLELNGDVVTDPAKADEMLAELTGIPTEAFFRSTASVRHHEVADLARDEASLRDRLQASISGADRGTSAARKKLDRALHDLTKGGDKFPGRLKEGAETVAELEASVAAGEEGLAQLEEDRNSLSEARDWRARAEEDLAQRRSMLEKARQAERLHAERDAARERFERYKTAVEVADQLAHLHDAHPSANPLTVLRQIVARLRTLDSRIRELTAALEGEIDVRFEFKEATNTWRPIGLIALVLILGGVAFFAYNRILAGADAVPMIAGVGAVALGAVLAYLGIRQRRVASDLRKQTELRSAEIDRRLRGRSQMEQELREAQAETANQLEALGLEDVTAAEDLLRREEEHVQLIQRLTGQLEGLVGKEPVDALPPLRDAAALEIEQKAHALEALGPIAKEPRARERLEVEVRDQEGVVDRTRDDEANARARVEANTVDSEAVAGSAERLESAREGLAALQRRERVYRITLQAIDDAERATMRSATRFLEKRMVGDLARISDGRYRRVRVDDRTLDIAVFAPEKGDWATTAELSQGTLDQIYLTARIGLVRLVTGDRRPPLIFDDPFVTFDDARALRALDLLRELASDFQVIFLTTSDRYDASADLVVELPAPKGQDLPEAMPDADGTAPGNGPRPARRTAPTSA
jgi:uncharacterized protein YhaN